jgi:plasmid stabilization system protein ParE
MTKALRYTPEAAIDVSTAFEWYESREPGLREEFLRCIEACTDMIQRHPEIFPVAVDQFRRGLIRRFPFELFYEASEGSIVVYSVFHCSQDPASWQNV